MHKFILVAVVFVMSFTALAQSNTNSGNMDQQTFNAFVNAINAHDVSKLYALMTDDHQFIDAQGNTVTGKDKMKAGWAGYFQLFPDYEIEVSNVFIKEDTVAAFGFVEASFKGKNHWRLPAAWKAVIENGKVKLWQVYADTKIPFDSMK